MKLNDVLNMVQKLHSTACHTIYDIGRMVMCSVFRSIDSVHNVSARRQQQRMSNYERTC
jgi:hypothetical protein